MSDMALTYVEGPEIGRKVATIAAVALAFVTVRRCYHTWKLNSKLEKKREQCRKTMQQVKQQLQLKPMTAEKRNSIVALSLEDLQSKLQSGVLNAVDVLSAYQDKALDVNSQINCIIAAFPDAQMEAWRCDKTGDKSRLLHGVPVSIKENIAMKGYDSTAGLQVNIGAPCTEDAVVVQVFRKHGAIPFIHTNIPQAMLSFTCSNPIFGATLNPHNLSRGPGGSSGGEGAVIGAGASIIGLGGDVGGSLRIPAAFCGICTIKSTMGRHSKQGVYSVYGGQTLIHGVVGPLARDVDSLVTMMRVLTSPEMFELDPSVPVMPFQEKLLTGTDKLRIGYYMSDGLFQTTPVVKRAVLKAKQALEANGHTLVQYFPTDWSKVYFDLYVGTMLGADQAETLRKATAGDKLDIGLKLMQLTKLPNWILSLLAAVVSLREPVVANCIRNFKTDGRTASWFLRNLRVQEFRKKFTEEWKQLGLNAVICPVFPSPAPKTEHVGLMTSAGSNVQLYNLVNFPAGVLPVTKVTAQDVADVNNPSLYKPRTPIEGMLKQSAGSKDSVGLPVAVQCITLPFREELCLRVMKEIEEAVNFKAS